MVVYGYDYWHFAWARGWRSDTVWSVRLWIPYLALPIGFGLLLLQLIADLVAVLIGVDKPLDWRTRDGSTASWRLVAGATIFVCFRRFVAWSADRVRRFLIVFDASGRWS